MCSDVRPATPNLLNDLDGLAGLLVAAVRKGRALDAFLLAAGMVQVADDWVQAVPGSVDRALFRLARRVPGWRGNMATRGARACVAGAIRARQLTPAVRAVTGWRGFAASLVDALADAVVTDQDPSAASSQAELVARAVAGLPIGARRSLLRIPSAFHGFDQRPADLERMTAEFTRRHPDRWRPVAVLGVRTSGSYTAPLHGAMLRRSGYQKVEVVTHRSPGPWSPGDARRLKSVLLGGGVAAITDDPPSTGGSVARTAHALEELGFARGRIVPLLALFGDSAPARLARYRAVLLPWHEWAVHERLQPAAVEDELRRCLPGAAVCVEARISGAEAVRGHVRALYRATFGGRQKTVLVEGIGLGYLGWYSAATAERLRPHLPEVYGIVDGLLYREWLAEDRRLARVSLQDERAVASAIGAYLAARAEAFGVAEDLALRLGRRGSVWRAAGDILARGFGRAQEPACLLTEAAAKRLLESCQPAVVDGATRMSSWFRDAGAHIVKVDADRAAFSRGDLYCYDLAYDLAGAAAGERRKFAGMLRASYREETSKVVDAERWLLYQLVHLEEQLRGGPRSPDSERLWSRTVQSYYAEVIFADTAVPPLGRICAIAVDGVLETSNLGYPVITPAAAIALRALARHGYRAILVTGRSLDELRERCEAYPIAGGVAEHGAAVYDSAAAQASSLLSRIQLDRLERLRSSVAAEGALPDPDYRASIRGYTIAGTGHRLPLDAARVGRILAAAGPGFQVIQGEHETDFVPAGVDTGRGARLLASCLGADAMVPLAMAIGCAEPDLSLFALAERRYAPANSTIALRRSQVTLLRQPSQLGFAEAVRRTIGHRPGGCDSCRPPQLSRRSILLLDILAAQERAGVGKLRPAVHALRSLRRLNGD